MAAVSTRPVVVVATGLYAPPADARGPGAVSVVGFAPREHLPEKKHAKLMSRSVQLGVAALKQAVERCAPWAACPPERRGLFAGASPGGGDTDEMLPALEASVVDGRFSLRAFGEKGIPLVPPLWLVRGLSNNVVGYGSSYFDIRGPNATRCDGRHAGLSALSDGIAAVAEGRCDLAACGASESLTWFTGAPIGMGEVGAFVILAAADGPAIAARTWRDPAVHIEVPDVEYGAATGLVELVRRLQAGERAFTIQAADAAGGCASVSVGAQG